MAKDLQKCGCSTLCKSQTRGSFAPGHDARMVSLMVHQVRYAMVDIEQASKEIRQAGGSDALVAKFRKAAARKGVLWEWSGETALVDISWQIKIQWFPTSERSWDGEYDYAFDENQPQWRVSWFNTRQDAVHPDAFRTADLNKAIDFVNKKMMTRDHGREFLRYQIALGRCVEEAKPTD